MLERKTFLVTGASRGIGRACVKALLEAGAKVVATARDEERLNALSSEMQVGERLQLAPCELRSVTERKVLCEFLKDLSALDGMLHVAGVAHFSSLVDGEPREWQEMLEVNVLAPAEITQWWLGEGRALERGGQVLFVSSLSGHRVPPSGGFYAASKHALRGVVEGLRLEVRARQSKVRVGMISPGFVETDLLSNYLAGLGKTLGDTGVDDILQPEDIAQLMLHQLQMPEHVEVNDVWVRPTAQQS